ncbi:MAG: YfhO family protein [Chitinispirillaceae bacterium]|nr:YfhO family protein [Chitinispirillaceae bacterium]
MAEKKTTVNEKTVRIYPAIVHKPWLYVGALALLCVIVFSGFFFSDRMLLSSDQLNGLDGRVFYKTSLVQHHQFPFWLNPRLGGMPTIDALFGDAFYPVSVIMTFLFPVDRAIGLKMILHIFLAGLFFFLMLRRGFGLSGPLAFVGGVFYMLNPEFFSHIYPGHDGKMFVIAWLPFMVWRLKALYDRTTLLNMTLLGLGIGMSLLTSHIQMTYFVLWGLFAYTVLAVIRNVIQKDHAKAVKFGGYFSLAVLVGLGIGFIQLYPSMMYVQHAFSVRGVDRGFEHAASWSLHWPEFFSLWVPEFGNTLEYYWGGNPFKLNSEYAGSLVLLFAVLAVAWKSRPWRWLWAGVAVFAALYALGAHTPVFHIAYAVVPGVKKFRACSMIMFWFSFSTVLLAMLFLKDMAAAGFSGVGSDAKKKKTRALFISIATLFAVALLFSIKDVVAGLPFVAELDAEKRRIFDANFSRNFLPMLWVWFFFAAAALGLVIAILHEKLKPAVAIGIIGVLGLIDVLRVNVQFIKLVDSRPYFTAEPAIQQLQPQMAEAPFRVFPLPGSLSQNGAGIHGMESVEGFHDNELRWYREFRGDQQNMNYFDRMIGFTANGEAYLKGDRIDKGNAFLDIANVRYLLGRNGRQLQVIENRNAFGRVSFAPKMAVMDSATIISALRDSGYDYRTTVAFLETPSITFPGIPDSAIGLLAPLSVTWQEYTPNRRSVKVTAPADGYLRISEAYYPGWKVMVDGKPVPVYRADLAWMAIPLTGGDHVVEMVPHSLYFAKAAWVTFPLVLVLCVFWAGVAIAARGRKRFAGQQAP